MRALKSGGLRQAGRLGTGAALLTLGSLALIGCQMDGEVEQAGTPVTQGEEVISAPSATVGQAQEAEAQQQPTLYQAGAQLQYEPGFQIQDGRPFERFRDEDNQRFMRNEWQASSYQRLTVRGRVQDVFKVNFGRGGDELLAKLKLEDGRIIPVNLGGTGELPNLVIVRDEVLEAAGETGVVNGRTVLFADRVFDDGQTWVIDRSMQLSSARLQPVGLSERTVTGRLLSSRIINVQGHANPHLLVDLSGDQGQIYTVDMGDPAALQTLQLAQGQQVQATGHFVFLDQKPVLMANRIRANDQLTLLVPAESRSADEMVFGVERGADLQAEGMQRQAITLPGGVAGAGAGTAASAAAPVDINITGESLRIPGQVMSGLTRFVVSNPGQAPRSFEVIGQNVDKRFITTLMPGETKVVQIDLPPGNYNIYAPIANPEALDTAFHLRVSR